MEPHKISYQGLNYCYTINVNNSALMDPIFFVSGAFQDMNSWKLISKHFLSKATLIHADLPGMGQADQLPSTYTFDFLVETIRHILKTIDITKVYIISASYGTPIAYKYAQKYPHTVSKLVMAGTMARLSVYTRSLIKKSITIAKTGDSKKFADFVLNNGLMYCKSDADLKINKFDFVKRLLLQQLGAFTTKEIENYVQNSERLLREDTLNLIKPMEVETLIFTGENDVFTTPKKSRELAVALHRTVFTTIKNADHLFHLEQTKTTIELLLGFGMNNLPNVQDNCNRIEFLR
jgi:pimeloyl-ACP methyl ester carboxylesterase